MRKLRFLGTLAVIWMGLLLLAPCIGCRAHAQGGAQVIVTPRQAGRRIGNGI